MPSVLALYSHLLETRLVYLEPVRRELMKSMRTRFSGIICLTAGELAVTDDGFGHSIYRVAAYLDPCYMGWLPTYIQLPTDERDALKSRIIGMFVLARNNPTTKHVTA